MSGAGQLHRTIENFFGDREKTLDFGVDDTHRDRSGIVTDPSVANDSHIHLNDVAIGNDPGTADSMDDFFIQADANMAGKFLVS